MKILFPIILIFSMEFLVVPAWAEVEQEGHPEKTDQEDRQQEAEEAARLRDLFLRQEKVFIRKGEFLGEFNTFYNTDETTVFTTGPGGTFVASRVQRRLTQLTLIGRYGVWDGLEFDLFIPVFVHARQELDIGPREIDREDHGFGDVSAAIRYQLIGERGGIPDVILDINSKSDTGGDNFRGTGNWNVGAGITFVKTLDPVVLFGRVGYTVTLAEDEETSDLGLTPVQVTRNPGDIFQSRIGMGFSLNDRVSFNLAVNGAFVGSSKLNGRTQRDSNLELLTLILSTTVLVTKQLFVEPVVGVGLTEDAFDTFVGIRLPYRF